MDHHTPLTPQTPLWSFTLQTCSYNFPSYLRCCCPKSIQQEHFQKNNRQLMKIIQVITWHWKMTLWSDILTCTSDTWKKQTLKQSGVVQIGGNSPSTNRWNYLTICNPTQGGQAHKMVKHTQTICWLLPTNCLSLFDHFVVSLLKYSKLRPTTNRDSKEDKISYHKRKKCLGSSIW